jgi:DNA mismatch repair protein MutS2
MDLIETRKKLEFDSIIESVKKFASSEPGLILLDNIPFYTDRMELIPELEKLEQMREYVGIEGEIELSKLKDIKPILEQTKIQGLFIAPEKLLWILDFLIISRLLRNNFISRSIEFKTNYTRLVTLAEELFFDKISEHNISTTIDENGEVKDSASTNLKRIRNDIRSKSEYLRKRLFKILKDFSENDIIRDDIVTLRDGRTVLPVRIENKRKIKGIIHSTSASGATIFIEPEETIELNNELTELQFEEKREIEKILSNLTLQISKYYNELKLNYVILAELDFLQAKAKYSLKISGIKPIFSDNFISLQKAYHPVLLENLAKESTIPINLKIGDEFNTLIITGPNAGGKTVALKTVGLLQMMLQSGFLIPCEETSSMKIFTKIFVNIGDEQSLQNNLSTFSSHLKAMKDILDNSNNNSLVLIDEICAGTDPAFGSALSCGILKDLSEKGCISLVTTHIGDLKLYAYNTPKIENASLEFNYETLSPNFNFIIGVPGQSFTFEIARKYNFPDALLKYSESFLTNQENNIENAIKDLNENKQKYQQLKQDYQLKNSKLKDLIKLYEGKNDELKNQEKTVLSEVKKKAENILKDANKLVEKTIKEIRENKDLKPKDVKNNFKNEVADLLNIQITELQENDNTDFKIKDLVCVKEGSAVGNILEIKDNYAIINFNGITLKSKIKELIKVDSLNTTIVSDYKLQERYDNEVPKNELDIRGLFTEDIKDLIDVFINNANINSIGEVRIIHGKGTGKLREKVSQLLKKNPSVKSFRLGNWNEGDSGVTIIEL